MTIREIVFSRDGRCRICRALGLGEDLDWRHEWAHLKARGMGGNPDGSRDTTANTVRVCHPHHTGRRSLHSGHVRPHFLSEQGADGPMAFSCFERLPTAEMGLKSFDVFAGGVE